MPLQGQIHFNSPGSPQSSLSHENGLCILSNFDIEDSKKGAFWGNLYAARFEGVQ